MIRYRIILEDGMLLTWGDNQCGSVGGYSSYTTYLEPYEAMENAVHVSGSQWVALAIDTDGTLWGWGSNVYGQLGQDVNIGVNTPVQIMENVVMASAGNQHCLALKKDGSLWAWGLNYDGQFGTGTVDDSNILLKHTPTMIMDDVRFAVASGDASYAIMEDGTLYGWGDNIGLTNSDGSTLFSSPVAIMDDVIYVSRDEMAIKEDGSLWVWGDCGYGDGQLDDAPTKIMEQVRYCNYGIAVQEDGSLWTWGDNTFGQLGDGTTEDRTEPVKVMDHVLYAVTTGFYTLIITDTGELWQAGYNSTLDGEVQEEELIQYYLPHKIMDGIMLPSTYSSMDAASGSQLADVITYPVVGAIGVCIILVIGIAIVFFRKGKKRNLMLDASKNSFGTSCKK